MERTISVSILKAHTPMTIARNTVATILALVVAGYASAQTIPNGNPSARPSPAATSAPVKSNMAGATAPRTIPAPSQPAVMPSPTPMQTPMPTAPAATANTAPTSGYTPMTAISPPWNANYQHTRTSPMLNHKPDMNFTRAKAPLGWPAPAHANDDARALVVLNGTQY